MASGAPRREVWALDAFAGATESAADADPIRATQAGGLYEIGCEEKVRRIVDHLADASRLRIVKGWFDVTLANVSPQIDTIALLHADTESEDATRLVLESFYDKIAEGGFVVVNTYGHWPCVREATSCFRREREITSPLVQVDYTAVYWRKP